jgi:hypothetical protein
LSQSYNKEELPELTNKLDELIDNSGYNWDNFYKEVIAWNLAFRPEGYIFTQEDIDLQHKLVLEEFNECLEELKKGDVYSLKKELVDLIVVSSFADYIKNKQEQFFPDNETYQYSLSDVHNWIGLHEYTWVIQFACAVLEKLGNFQHIADGILKANWSKIPTVEEFLEQGADYYGHKILDVHIEHECKMIEQLSAGRYSGVTCKEVEIKGNKHLIFTDNNGKVMKPSTFKAFK